MKLSLWTTSHQEPSNDTKSRVGNALHGLGDLNMTYQTNNRYPCSWKGPLVEAKIWKVRISSNQWKGSACNHGPQFCYFGFWGGRGGGGEGEKGGRDFPFSPLYQCVPTMFPKFPKTFPKASHVLWQVFLLSPTGRPKGKNSMHQNKTLYFGESPWFPFFRWWANQIASLQKKQIKEWTWEVPI
jgi:hypothetical protein